ncbi:4284_t:CDS:2 [Cetraspora pellucida]|uniref:4284_t:CDS:1 n=1 Tax=Cetraspora pellucida TaxID=1433469 RepID=A0A9N8WKA3_9GLOM|nr:4284_t:CDS:2 [Cetraspora pellucida]
MSELEPILHFICSGNGDCLILEFNDNTFWLIDGGSAQTPYYQYLRIAIFKRRITAFEGIIITNVNKNRIDGVTKLFNECFPLNSTSDKEFQDLKYIILTEEFRDLPIVKIIKQYEFEEINEINDIQIIKKKTFIKCFFHEKGSSLIFRRKKNDEKKEGFNIVSYMPNIPVHNYVANTASNFMSNYMASVTNYVTNSSMANYVTNSSVVNYVANFVPMTGEFSEFKKVDNEKSLELFIKPSIEQHISVITYLQHTLEDGNVNTMFLTSDNDASWILEVLRTNLRKHQKISQPDKQQNLLQSNELLTIDLFKVPNHGSRINSIFAKTYVPKYVNQQFTLMMILYYGEQFSFYDNEDKSDIVADFEHMFNLTNFGMFEEAALSREYLTSAFDPTSIKIFLKYMADALVISDLTEDKVDWKWNEINWGKIGRELYKFYEENQNIDPINWKKYDFIKNKDNISEEELDHYFNSIKERIYKNFDIIICTNQSAKIRPQYAKNLKPLLNSMWNSLNLSPLAFQYIVTSISTFYKSFIAKTYVISSESKHGHPDPLIVAGIVKSILEDSNKERIANILFTNESKINMNLLAATINNVLENEAKQSIDFIDRLNQRIEIYANCGKAYEVSVKLSSYASDYPKNVMLFRWDPEESKEIKKVYDILNCKVPSHSTGKNTEFRAKISSKKPCLWLGVNTKGDLIPVEEPTTFLLSNIPPIDQYVYRMSNGKNNFIIKFEWIVKNRYDNFYLMDLELDTGKVLYYAIDNSTPSSQFKKLPTNEGALVFSYENQSDNQKKGQTLESFLKELGEYKENLIMKVKNAANYIMGPSNVERAFSSLPSIFDKILYSEIDIESEVEWEITKDKLLEIKNATIKLKETELPRLTPDISKILPKTFDKVTNVQINVQNPRIEGMEITVKIDTENKDKSNSYFTWASKIPEVSQSRSIFDYLLNANVQQNNLKSETLTLGYLCLLMMPQSFIIPEFLKIPLPFTSKASLLNCKVNQETSEVDFLPGPTGTRIIQSKFFLETEGKLNFQLENILISQIADIKVIINDPGVVNNGPRITIDAFAEIENIESGRIFTQNDNEQFILLKFDNKTLAQITKVVLKNNICDNKITHTRITTDAPGIENVCDDKITHHIENIFDNLKVPLYEKTLNDLLKDNKMKFCLSFHPICEPPTINFKMKDIQIFANDFLKIEKSMLPHQFSELLLTNKNTVISILNPLDKENIMIGLDINFNLLIAGKNLLANLSYIPIKETEQKYTSTKYVISIKSQNLDDKNAPPNLEDVLNAIGLNEIFKKLKDTAPMLSNPIFKELKSVTFRHLYLQVKSKSNSNTFYEIGDFELGITIPSFIIKKDVIEVENANIDLEYCDEQWSGKIKSMVAKGNDISNCLIEYVSPTKESFGSLIIKNFPVYLTFNKILEILQLNNVFKIPILSDLFKSAIISEINITLTNSDTMDFIIQELSIILRADEFNLENLNIKQLNIHIFYSSAIWKCSMEGNFNSIITKLSYDNEKRQIHATLTPFQNKSLKETVKLLTKETIPDDAISELNINSANLVFNIDNKSIETFSIELEGILIHEKAIISLKDNDNICAEITLNYITKNTKKIIEGSFSSPKKLKLSEVLQFTGIQCDLSKILPNLPNLPKFDDLQIAEKNSITISTNPFQIVKFSISTEAKEYILLKDPLLVLKPVGVSINYEGTKDKVEGKIYGTFALNNGTKLNLVIAGSKTSSENTFIVRVYITNGENVIKDKYSVDIGTFVNTLLKNDEWSDRKPKEMELPQFIIKSSSNETETYLYICSDKNDIATSIALYGKIESIGSALLLIKPNTKKSTMRRFVFKQSLDSDSKWNYLFALKTLPNLKFENLFDSEMVSDIDKVVPLTQSNLVLVSYQGETIDQVKKESDEMIKKITELIKPDKKIDDIISVIIPTGRDDIYKRKLGPGLSLYVEFDYNKDYLILENLHATVDPSHNSMKITVALYMGLDKLSNCEFKAGINDFKLIGGIHFEKVEFSYKPGVSNRELNIFGKLNFEKLLDTEFWVEGTLKISEKISSFEVKSISKQITSPFEKMKGIIFRELKFIMKFKYEDSQNTDKFNGEISRKIQESTYELSGKVKFSYKNSEIILSGGILFVNSTPRVCQVTIDQETGINALLKTIFIKGNHKWSNNFPDIVFNNGELYYAQDEIKIDEKIYTKGFNANAHIDFFGIEKLFVTVKITDGMTIEVTDDKINAEINLGFVKLYNYKLLIHSNVNHNSISMEGSIKLFDKYFAKFVFEYDQSTKRLSGEISEIFGNKGPKIKGYWSKKDKFVITEWYYKLDWESNKFAKFIEKASNINPKCQILDLVLEETFTGDFKISMSNFKTQNNTVSFDIVCTYSINIKASTKSTEIANIVTTIHLNIDYPTEDYFNDIAGYLLKCLKDNTAEFLKSLLRDPEKFAMFVDALAISTLKNLGESAIKGFGCIAGDKLKDSRSKIKERIKEVVDKERPKREPSESEIEEIERAKTLSEAIAKINSPLLLIGEWFAFFEWAILFLTFGGVKKILDDDESELKKVKKTKEKIQGRINNVIRKFLFIDSSTIELEFSSENTLKINWKMPSKAKDDKLAINIIFDLQITGNAEKFGDEVNHNESNIKGPLFILVDDKLMKCFDATVAITAILLVENDAIKKFTGLQSAKVKISHSRTLLPPTTLMSKYDPYSKCLTIDIKSLDPDIERYLCELADRDHKWVYYTIIDVNTSWVIDTDKELIGAPGGEYTVCVKAKAEGWKDSKFVHAEEIVSQLLPPKVISLDYQPNTDYLQILVDDENDMKKVSGYFCQLFIRMRILSENIINSNYKNTENSFKFLSNVADIKAKYSNNSIKLSWKNVTNANSYQAAVYICGNRIKTFYEQANTLNINDNEIDKFEEIKPTSVDSTALTYSFSIQAMNGNSIKTLHGQETFADKKFTQLPKPTDINIEVINNRENIRITFVPIDNQLSNLREYIVGLYNTKSNKKLVKMVHSNSNSCIFEANEINLKFEENDTCQVRVYSISSKVEEVINSFPAISTDVLRLLPKPRDLEISYKQGSIYVSCTAEPENHYIKSYWFHIENKNSKENSEDKTIEYNGSLKIIEKFSSDLINSPDGSEIQIYASAKAIGHDLILDSKIKTSDSTDPNSYLVKYAAPRNVKHEIKSNSIIVTYNAPNKGRYEIQIINRDNCDENVITSVKEYSEEGEVEIEISSANFNCKKYTSRVKQILKDEDNSIKRIESIWKYSENEPENCPK